MLPVAAVLLVVPLTIRGQDEGWPPGSLRETRLYSDWDSKTVAADNLPFSPQYPLWSDGAVKSRWLHIPKGRFIDGSNPDVWKFPVGTRLWKEFRFGRRVETRFMSTRAPACNSRRTRGTTMRRRRRSCRSSASRAAR